MSGAALVLAGCGGGRKPTPRELALERADLVLVCRALSAVEQPVAGEVAATKAAWPLVVNGLPSGTSAVSSPAIALAAQRAAALKLPALFEEGEAASITGPGSSIAGLYRAFSLLATRGWQLIAAAAQEIEHGSPTAASFARANVALYIESVYDAHFGLAQIGKKLLDGYKKLGGPHGFGASLTQAEVDALAMTYSEARDRLRPHVRVRLGS